MAARTSGLAGGASSVISNHVKRMANGNLISGLQDCLLREIPEEIDSTDLHGKDLISLLMIFLNWRARLIPQVPRKLIYSKEYEVSRKSHIYSSILCAIERLTQEGGDLTPYLSTAIRYGYVNDVNSAAHDKDFLINDLRIHHLHLGGSLHPKVQGFVNRTRDLLFAVFTQEEAYFLDVLGHYAFGDARLAEIILGNWPDSGLLIALDSILPGEEWTNKERRELRKNGMATTFNVYGTVYTGSGFISSAGYSQRAVRAAAQIYRIVSAMQECVERGEYSLLQEIYATNGLQWSTNACFQFAFLGYYFGIFEEQAKIFVRLVELP